VELALVKIAEKRWIAESDNRKATHRMHPDDDLDRLMARYQEGDSAAAAALIERAGPQLYRFFAARAGSRAEADDLLQETWLRIHRVRHTYRPGEPVLPWLYAIARHIRVDHYRKTVRVAVGARRLEAEASGAVTMPEEGGAGELAAMLAPLSEGERDVVEMLKVAGMSLEEVARATSSTVGAVKQKAHRAYKKLRATLGLRSKGGRP
jgi:RNA polymerase sigma-70 factor (ECF subfamily)